MITLRGQLVLERPLLGAEETMIPNIDKSHNVDSPGDL